MSFLCERDAFLGDIDALHREGTPVVAVFVHLFVASIGLPHRLVVMATEDPPPPHPPDEEDDEYADDSAVADDIEEICCIHIGAVWPMAFGL